MDGKRAERRGGINEKPLWERGKAKNGYGLESRNGAGEGQGGGMGYRPATAAPLLARRGPPAFAKATGLRALGSCSSGCERIDVPPACAKSYHAERLLGSWRVV